MPFVRIVIFAALATTGCKGDRDKCEKASRNYAELTFWKKANADIEALPEAERSTARQKKLSAFTNELETRIDSIVSQCMSANNEEQVDCMIAAKTAEAAAKCADLAGTD